MLLFTEGKGLLKSCEDTGAASRTEWEDKGREGSQFRSLTYTLHKAVAWAGISEQNWSSLTSKQTISHCEAELD